MANQKLLLSLLSFLFLLAPRIAMAKDVISVKVGVVLDLKSPVGGIAELCMSMALSDFYEENDNYTTRLVLSTKDSGGDVVAAASAGTYVELNPKSSLQYYIFLAELKIKKKKEKKKTTNERKTTPESPCQYIPKLQNIPLLYFGNFPLTNIRARTFHWIFFRICTSVYG
jgi:hypothetical protein